MAENTAANHGGHFNESIVNEVILEDMKKNRIDHMKYLPGMETMEESDVMEKVITAMNAYDYDQYTEKANGGLENMINWEGKDKDMLALIKYIADEDKLAKILENPQVIRTPVVRNGKQSTLGYQPGIWKGWK